MLFRVWRIHVLVAGLTYNSRKVVTAGSGQGVRNLKHLVISTVWSREWLQLPSQFHPDIVWDPNPENGTPHYRLGLPKSDYIIKIPHQWGHSSVSARLSLIKNLFSTLDHIKLTVKTEHYTCIFGYSVDRSTVAVFCDSVTIRENYTWAFVSVYSSILHKYTLGLASHQTECVKMLVCVYIYVYVCMQ